MSAKHTPGPWVVSDDGCGIEGALGEHIALLSFPERSVSQANARLIAAAPELLSSLRDLVNAWESADEEPSIVTRARAAIAKAEIAK